MTVPCLGFDDAAVLFRGRDFSLVHHAAQAGNARPPLFDQNGWVARLARWLAAPFSRPGFDPQNTQIFFIYIILIRQNNLKISKNYKPDVPEKIYSCRNEESVPAP